MKDLSNENVIHIKKDGIEYLQFRRLLEYGDIINHAYCLGTERNFRTARAKDKAQLTQKEYKRAIKDYDELCSAININYNNVVKPNQAHTKNVMRIEQKVNENSPDINLKEYDKTDGSLTNEKNIALATTNADCILLLFFDPVKKVIANVHSGWKGTLHKMQQEYGCEPKDTICCICPSIRKCHFEVRSDVQELYYKEFKELQKIGKIITPITEETWTIDTVEINKIILKEAGLKEENIIDCGICSVCNSDLIHSYRAEKEEYGLSTAIIELK